MINRAGAAAGLGHIHPHQLRHTLATQAINRGMSLEAIAAMLGHKSMDMTLVYAKIANRTVAQEYFTVAEKVDALYANPAQLPADALGPNMARLNREHSRMLGNGYCARPKVMDCQYETICESCTFFATTIEFRPTLLAQREDACAKGQVRRAQIYDNLITGLDNDRGLLTTDTSGRRHAPGVDGTSRRRGSRVGLRVATATADRAMAAMRASSSGAVWTGAGQDPGGLGSRSRQTRSANTDTPLPAIGAHQRLEQLGGLHTPRSTISATVRAERNSSATETPAAQASTCG